MPASVDQRIETTISAQATAATVQDNLIGEAELPGRVTGASLTPEAAITGAAGNNRKFAVVNKGGDGTGTKEIAAITFGAGVNAATFDEVALTLSATETDRDVAAGDQLLLVETVNGTGMASPGGRVQVEITRTG